MIPKKNLDFQGSKAEKDEDIPQCMHGSHQKVESRCGAVAKARHNLFPGSFDMPVSQYPAMLRFHTPLIEPDVRISRIRLSDKKASASTLDG